MRRIFIYLPFLAAAAMFTALFLTAQHPSRLPAAVAVLGAVALATSGALCYQALWRGSSIAPGAMPALLVAGVSFSYFFLENDVLRIAVAAMSSVLFLVLVRHLAETSKLEGAAGELRALSEWSALIALLGIAAGLLASITFLVWNVWLCTAVFAVVAAYASFTIARLARVAGWIAPVAVSVLLIQGFVVIAALPVSHWVGSGVLAVVAYLLFSLLTGLAAASMKRTLISAGVMCGLLLGTARWR